MIRKTFIFLFLISNLTFSSGSAKPDSEFYAGKLKISEEQVNELVLYAEKKGVDFNLVYNLLYVETGGKFNHDAVGPKVKTKNGYIRAYGIAQFMENTAPWIAKKAGLPYKNKNDLFDPIYSIKLAITYLSYLQYGDGKTHSGYHEWHSTLTAYNRGMYGLKKYKTIHSTPVSTYSKRVLTGKY